MALFVLVVVAGAGAAQEPARASPRFEELAFALSTKPAPEAVARMRRFVDAHPGGEDAARGLVWIARLKLDGGDRAAARTTLHEAQVIRTRTGREALRLAAAMDLEDGHLGAAEEESRALAACEEPRQAAAGQRMLDAIRSRRWHRFALIAVIFALVVDVGLRAWRSKRGLWPPPFEAQAAGPVLGLLAVLGAVERLKELPAIAALAAGGVVLLWARGAHRWARPLRPALRVADAALAVVETLALAWAVFEGAGLVDKLALFFTAGPA